MNASCLHFLLANSSFSKYNYPLVEWSQLQDKVHILTDFINGVSTRLQRNSFHIPSGFPVTQLLNMKIIVSTPPHTLSCTPFCGLGGSPGSISRGLSLTTDSFIAISRQWGEGPCLSQLKSFLADHHSPSQLVHPQQSRRAVAGLPF